MVQCHIVIYENTNCVIAPEVSTDDEDICELASSGLGILPIGKYRQ